MIVVSLPSHAELGPNDHREEALHFIILGLLTHSLNTKIDNFHSAIPRIDDPEYPEVRPM